MNTTTWPTSLREAWQRYRDAGYTVILQEGFVHLFHAGAPRHCLATEIDNGSWIGCPAMSTFIQSHLHEDMAGEITSRVLPPWRHVSVHMTPGMVLAFRQIARACYCYQGVDRCDFCTGLRSPDRHGWESGNIAELADLLIACGYVRQAPCRFTHPIRGWAAIHGDGSAAGLPAIYYVHFEKRKGMP